MNLVFYLSILLVCLLASGCVASNFADVIDKLGNDQANMCVTASSPYGGGAVGRVNTPGVKLNASGGQCTIESAPAAPDLQGTGNMLHVPVQMAPHQMNLTPAKP